MASPWDDRISRSEWQREVSEGDTRLGYSEWVEHVVESAANDTDDDDHAIASRLFEDMLAGKDITPDS